MARDNKVEAILREKDVPFEFRERFPLTKVRYDPEDESQVRQGNDHAPTREIKQYAGQLRAGAEFPPILIRKRDHLVFDGNTRYRAHQSERREVISVYVVDVESPMVMKQLSIAVNQTQGKRCSKKDILAYLTGMNGTPIDGDQFVRDTGWSRTSLAKYLALKEVEERLQVAGINRGDKSKPRRKVDDAVQVHINTVRQTEPFLEFYKLAEDSGLKAGDARTLAAAIREAPSEADMLVIIETERAKRKAQIQEVRAGLTPAQQIVNLIRLHCGWIVKQGAPRLEDHNLATREESREWLEKAQRALTSALVRYDDDAGAE